MKAFAYDTAHGLDSFSISLRDLPDPVPGPKDLLVGIRAFSFNPVDYKIRQSRSGSPDAPVVLGWDASGVVEAVGAEVEGFAPGDEVYYAGDIARAGSYAERQTVDFRLAARKPQSIGFADAAALPLTALTAYEALLERGIDYGDGSHVLITGAAGGVGSIAIQLLKAMTPATVIAGASRAETIAWVKALGADHVVGRNLTADMAAAGVPSVDAVFSTTHTQDYLSDFPGILRPFGHLMVIDDPDALDIRQFKAKALSVHWEFMFAKAREGYRPESQGSILRQVASLVDAGRVRSTRTRSFPADVEGLREAHTILEGGAAKGKLVMEW